LRLPVAGDEVGLLQDPGRALLFVHGGQNVGAAEEEEARSGEEHADQVPGPPHHNRVPTAIQEGQDETVDRNGKAVDRERKQIG
jgi:hypothetical protein